MSDLHEARFYEPLADGRVLCTLCPHDCRIPDGARGACAVRYNHRGKLYTLVYDKVAAREVDPIEKKPLFHFHPGSRAYSISTVGCNLRCSFCQNWYMSQWPKEHLAGHIQSSGGGEGPEPICPQLTELEHATVGETVTPAEIVRAATEARCQSVCYTFTEPTIFYELAYDTAVLARRQGLKNTFVTNGFISSEPAREISTVLDGANVDLKFFRDQSYRRVSRARLQPVLDAIALYHGLGVWLEVTTLVIPGLNDSDGELRDIAGFIHDLDPAIPWHVTQFYPTYKMLERPPTPAATLRRAREIGLQVGLHYVYEGNIPGGEGENTYCHHCHALLIERYGYVVRENRIRNDRCPDCQTPVAGVAMSGA